ncbi:MAG: hypothetical protein ACR2PT_08685 [Endozoicomonas sp.]
MKLPTFNSIRQIFSISLPEALSRVKELKVKLVRGLPIISKAARPKPFEDKSIASRNIRQTTPSTPVATTKSSPPIGLASARTTLMEQVRAGLAFSGEVNESLLNTAADLALVDKGLAQFNGKTLEATGKPITAQQQEELENQVYECVADPEKNMAECLDRRPLPVALVTAYLKASGEENTQDPKLDIVLGDFLLAGINNQPGAMMNRNAFDHLMDNAKVGRSMRTGAAEKQNQYLEQLIAMTDDPAEKGMLEKFRDVRNEHLETHTRMLPEITNLAREFGCPAWQGTLNAMALTTDGIAER